MTLGTLAVSTLAPAHLQLGCVKTPPEPLSFHSATPEGQAMKIACAWPKAVSVMDYYRYRLGRWEHVCSHCRSYPSR